MNFIPNYIENDLLQTIRHLSGKHLIQSTLAKTKLVKIYKNDNEIVYQVKNTITKRAVRFLIPLESKDNVVLTLVVRSKNPNTIEFFEDFFSVKETILIYDIGFLEKYFIYASVELDKPNDALKATSYKIKTTKLKEELNKENLYVKTIKDIVLTDTKYEITFMEDDEVFKIDRNIKIKLPFPDDLMFRDINGRYQFYSRAKARYHFELNRG